MYPQYNNSIIIKNETHTHKIKYILPSKKNSCPLENSECDLIYKKQLVKMRLYWIRAGPKFNDWRICKRRKREI
jgi:hypothetical protein